MATHLMPSSAQQRFVHSNGQQNLEARAGAQESASMRQLGYLVPVGRVLYATIFLASAPMHFSSEGIGHAAQTGVPVPHLLVPASGVVMLLGALSVLLGYRARMGALLLAAFLVPVTLTMHAFWSVADPGAARIQQIMFMKNVSMLGAALLLAYFGAGPVSIDSRWSKLQRARLLPSVTGV